MTTLKETDLKTVVEELSGMTWKDVKYMAFHLPKMSWSKLKEIEAAPHPGERVIDAMDLWLNCDTSASWNDLVSALRKVDKHREAEKIRVRHCPNMPPQIEPEADTATASDSPHLGQHNIIIHRLFTPSAHIIT